MNLAGSLGRLGAALDRPGTAFVAARGQEGDQAQQVIAGGDQTVKAALFNAELGEEHIALFGIHAGDFLFDGGGNGDAFAAFGGGDGAYALDHLQIIRFGHGIFGDVGGIDNGLLGEQEPLIHQRLFIVAHVARAGGLARFQVRVKLLRGFGFKNVLFIARLVELLRFVAALLNGFHVCEDQLQRDRLDIAGGIDRAIHVDDVVILKAAHDVHDGVALTDVREELVAQAFAVAGTLDQSRDIHEFHRGGRGLFGGEHGRQMIQTIIRHGNDAGVRLDGAERIVGRLRAGIGNGIKQGAFAHIGQTDNA